MKYTKSDINKCQMFLGYSWDMHKRSFVRIYLDYFDINTLGLCYNYCRHFEVNPKKFFNTDIFGYCDADRSELLTELEKYGFVDMDTINEFSGDCFWSSKKQEQKRTKTLAFVNAILQRFPRAKLEMTVRKMPYFKQEC